MESSRTAGRARRYEFRVVGRLSERARCAFRGMHVREVPAETVIRGDVAEDGGIQQVLDVIQRLGMQVVSVRSTSAGRRAD
jgi:hypothetical protein